MRNQSVEALRIIAALGIVWFHAKAPGGDFAYAGLAVFLALCAYFEAIRSKHHALGSLALKLLLPWAVFMAIFAAKDLVLGRRVFDADHIVAGILTGSSPHLWFLPFMFAVLALLILADRVLPRRAVGAGAAIVTLWMVATQHQWRPAAALLGSPFVEYAYSIIPVAFGIALARVSLGRFVAVPLALAGMGLVMNFGSNGAYLIGLGAVLLAVYLPTYRFNVSWLAGAMFGVYLVHPLALSALRPMRDAGWIIPAVLLAFIMSIAVVFVWRMVVKAMPHGVSAQAR